MSLDDLKDIAAFFNDASHGTLLLAFALVALILAAVFVVWMRDRVIAARRRKQDPAAWDAEAVDQASHDADCGDPVEDFIRDALRYEADREWLLRGERPEERGR
ncbi:hypothetical protein ABZ897_00500 [Nonomuraea sp. NPDC046802]|uniref:hypothetical protein n=1 Tax=Nonomuraea sp. NPDC046802 TaxID=3154919 RepID=UPI0033FBFBC4